MFIVRTMLRILNIDNDIDQTNAPFQASDVFE